MSNLHRARVGGIAAALTSVVLSMGAALAAVPVEPARPDDYAYGWSLLEAPGAPFLRVPLTREVRAAAVSPALADLAVFDDDDRRMPAFVIEPAPEAAVAPPPVALPVFETEEALTRGGSSKVTIQASGGADVQAQITVGEGDAPAPLRRWYAMVADDLVPRDWIALRAQWDAGASPQVITLEVEASDDLVEWRQVTVGALAALASGQSMLKRDRIDLVAPLGRYLRLTAYEAPADWRLTGVELVAPAPVVESEREWNERALAPGTDTLAIDLGAAIRVDRFELKLAQGSGLRRARLSSADDPAGPWVARADVGFYSVMRPQGFFETGAVSITPVTARHWRVEVEGEGAAGATLRLGWPMSELVFMAQGRAPYRLVAGLAKPDPAPDLGADARALYRADDAAFAALGPRVELAGEHARTPVDAPDWKRWALWALLAFGVIAVLAMATQLVRELKSSPAA